MDRHVKRCSEYENNRMHQERPQSSNNIDNIMPSILGKQKKHKCEFCNYRSDLKYNFDRHVKRCSEDSESKLKMHKCTICDFKSKRKYNVQIHEKRWHKSDFNNDTSGYQPLAKSHQAQQPLQQQEHQVLQTQQQYHHEKVHQAPHQDDHNGYDGVQMGLDKQAINIPNDLLLQACTKPYDIRLKENFKMFISGPSRCGKTFFVSDLLDNIDGFSKQTPQTIIYIYTVWQTKFDEMRSVVDVFIQDNENMINQIQNYARGQPVFVIFDDLINSNSLPEIAKLFTVDGRHMNMSMAFLTQRMFVNNEHFRQISQNCDYFCVFKNPRNSSEIRTLAQQLTPGSLDLIDIYMEATKNAFSYLFINLTQECQPQVKYLSSLFDYDNSVKVYVSQ